MRLAAGVALAVLAVAGTAAAQTATTGTPQALFTKQIIADAGATAEIRDGLKARRIFVDPDVTFVELTGDGRQDAIVRVDSGGAAGAIAVFVFSSDGASKLRPVYRNQRLFRALASNDGAALIVRTPRYAPGDELCCAGAFTQRTLTWSARSHRMVLRDTRTVPRVS
jgi:hypothetical protein